jgi:hypothetical protein
MTTTATTTTTNNNEQIDAYNTLRTYEDLRAIAVNYIENTLRYKGEEADLSTDVKQGPRDAAITNDDSILDIIIRNIVLHPHVNTSEVHEFGTYRFTYRQDNNRSSSNNK